jgi:glucose/arabinose dehydrogenase
MMSIKASRLALAGLAAFLVVVPAAAQAPDCTGISAVHNTDPDLDGELTTVVVASGFQLPLYVTSPPGDVHRLFVVEQDGTIKIIRDGVVLATPFLDVSAITYSPSDGANTEEGLLGLAFHPDYASNGWFFIYHTDSTGSQQAVARYTVSANPDVADPTSRVQVITLSHPFDDQNGGMLAFGPLDGHLYIGVGDGGGDCDPNGNGQDLNTNLGKILRLNVDSLPPSTTGNPFDGGVPGNDEIWSYGLRNPWRFSFDRILGQMLIGDVGEDIWEEVDCQPPLSGGGENYGWSRYEGPVCPSTSMTCPGTGSCLITGYVPPIRTYDHQTDIFSCSVTGGYVYRGCRMGDLHGTYFYADYCSNQIRSFRVDETCATSATDILRTADLDPDGAGGVLIWSITSFGEDAQGELYLVGFSEIFKILPTLSIMEVSGLNAPPLRADANGDWIWEDLRVTSGHPIANYKVYRAGLPTGTFFCVHQGISASWAGGDPVDPALGNAFYYVVTALDAAGEQSRPGHQNVDLGSACP